MLHNRPHSHHVKALVMSRPIVTRFAPSPTGFLHIGGARTALFNWAFAKHHGGKMLLRIEDTDRERSTQEATDALLDGLTWLGLDWEGEPVSQHARADRHAEIAKSLVDSGHAYYCYCTPEELTEMRAKARADGQPPRYDGTWRDRDPSEAPAGAKAVVRIKTPANTEIIIKDHVQGRVVFNTENLDDFIILRSDGSPTYMLAVVVDDHDMEVSHIIRGDDHLTNAARQIVIYNALGWDVPDMAHIPLIHGQDGAKLSKRHGALGVDAYRKMGYLPEAIRNYLARLGWAHGDDEVFSTEQMVEWFGLDALNKGASRFDFAKLENLNGIHIRQSDPLSLYIAMLDLTKELDRAPDVAGLTEKKDMVLAALPELQPRAKTVLDLIKLAQFAYAQRPLEIEENATKHVTGDNQAMLGRLLPILKDLKDWNAEAINAVTRTFSESEELKLGKVAQPMRVALTGGTVSAGVFEIMTLLGKDESLARLQDRLG